jgi:hypothetical protein
VDAYWWETKQTRTPKQPELTETIIQSSAAEECALRKVYVPMTAEEYNPATDSLYVTSAPQCGGGATDRLLTLDGVRYLERSYAENNQIGCVKTFWILKAQNMAVTDMGRWMSVTQRPSGADPQDFVLTFPKPSWFDQSKDKMELYRDVNESLPKSQWTSADSEIQEPATVENDTIKIRIYPGYSTYGLLIYHSAGGTDLRNAVITESVKTKTITDTVPFFPMPQLEGFDRTKDLLWIFSGGSRRDDYRTETGTYDDNSTADFLMFSYSIGGTVEFRYYHSTATPPLDVRQYTAAQVEEGLKSYEIVTEEAPHFIDAGFIQTGDAAARQQLTMQQHTMADGSVCVYPAQNPVTRMTLELECTQRQARHLEEAICHVPLLLTGVKSGAVNALPQSYPQEVGRLYILDGEVEIGEKYSGSGIFSVTLPLIVYTGHDGTRFCEMYDIQLYYDDAETPEGFSSFHYSPREPIHDLPLSYLPSGLFVRNRVYYTNSDTFSFKYQKGTSTILLNPYNLLYQGDTLIKQGLAPDTVQEFSLERGENVFTFYFYDGHGNKIRSENYRIIVYRRVTP